MIEHLQTQHQKKQNDLAAALARYTGAGKQGEERLFAELCFCLCTPQSKARACDLAIQTLQKENLLFKGNHTNISNALVKSGVRFHKNKANYILAARAYCKKNPLTALLSSTPSDLTLREILVKHIKGLGYKEASHFLRNVGRWENLAILDRHILKNLVAYKAIRSIPSTLTPKKYFAIEKKMQTFAKNSNIPLEHLDLLFWSEETGEIFK